jgi:cell division protein FtsL
MYIPHNTNLAYDLSLFDTDEQLARKAQRREKAVIKEVKISAARNGSMFRTILTVGCCAAIAFIILFSKVELSELATHISEETQILNAAISENKKLQSELDRMVSLEKVEECAINELGMQKTQSAQIEYIRMNSESIAEVAPQDNNGPLSVIQGWFLGVAEYFGLS